MHMTEAQTYSQNIKKQADLILKKTQLVESLSRFGTVHIIGSYPMDLMYNPDIDIIVTSKDIRASSLKALEAILQKRICQKIEYGDFVKFKRVKRPAGYIMVLKIISKGVLWEVEIWFLPSAQKEEKFMEKVMQQLTPEKKKLILEFKHLINQNHISKHQISSSNIYRAVLEKNVTSFAALLQQFPNVKK